MLGPGKGAVPSVRLLFYPFLWNTSPIRLVENAAEQGTNVHTIVYGPMWEPK